MSDTRAQFLAALSRLEGKALAKYDQTDPEQEAAVSEGLRRPYPKVQPDRVRHQPAPTKD